jgi:hypothetical protein
MSLVICLGLRYRGGRGVRWISGYVCSPRVRSRRLEVRVTAGRSATVDLSGRFDAGRALRRDVC